jgi:hypothetical protein
MKNSSFFSSRLGASLLLVFGLLVVLVLFDVLTLFSAYPYYEESDRLILSTDTCSKNYKFIIASTQRSGTHWLRDSLELHPQFSLEDELFNVVKLSRLRDFFSLLPEARLNGTQVASVLASKIYSIPIWGENEGFLRTTKTEVDGFILQYNQMALVPELMPLLHEMGYWKAIHLTRENFLNVHLSKVLQPFSRPHLLSIRLDVNNTLSAFQLLRRMHREIDRNLRSFKIPFITTSYEGLLNRTESFCTIWKFMGCTCLESSVLDGWLSSSPPRRHHQEMIENYDEIYHALAGTPWFHFLDK